MAYQYLQTKADIIPGPEVADLTIKAQYSFKYNLLSQARIAGGAAEKIIESKANIKNIYRQDLESKVNIQSIQVKNLTIKANLFIKGIKDLSSKGNIWINYKKDLSSKGQIAVVEAYKNNLRSQGNIYFSLPILVSPFNNTSEPTPLIFVWDLPTNYPSNIYSHIQFDKTDNTFNDIETEKKSRIDSNFEYWNGNSWIAYPTAGVGTNYGGNQARLTIGLTKGNKWWRVRCGIKY